VLPHGWHERYDHFVSLEGALARASDSGVVLA
jgi:hypothetical protein